MGIHEVHEGKGDAIEHLLHRSSGLSHVLPEDLRPLMQLIHGIRQCEGTILHRIELYCGLIADNLDHLADPEYVSTQVSHGLVVHSSYGVYFDKLTSKYRECVHG